MGFRELLKPRPPRALGLDGPRCGSGLADPHPGRRREISPGKGRRVLPRTGPRWVSAVWCVYTRVTSYGEDGFTESAPDGHRRMTALLERKRGRDRRDRGDRWCLKGAGDSPSVRKAQVTQRAFPDLALRLGQRRCEWPQWRTWTRTGTRSQLVSRTRHGHGRGQRRGHGQGRGHRHRHDCGRGHGHGHGHDTDMVTDTDADTTRSRTRSGHGHGHDTTRSRTRSRTWTRHGHGHGHGQGHGHGHAVSTANRAFRARPCERAPAGLPEPSGRRVRTARVTPGRVRGAGRSWVSESRRRDPRDPRDRRQPADPATRPPALELETGPAWSRRAGRSFTCGRRVRAGARAGRAGGPGTAGAAGGAQGDAGAGRGAGRAGRAHSEVAAVRRVLPQQEAGGAGLPQQVHAAAQRLLLPPAQALAHVSPPSGGSGARHPARPRPSGPSPRRPRSP